MAEDNWPVTWILHWSKCVMFLDSSNVIFLAVLSLTLFYPASADNDFSSSHIYAAIHKNRL